MKSLFVCGLLLLGAAACGKNKVDCDKLDAKLRECSVQFVKAISPQAATLPDDMIKGLADTAITGVTGKCKEAGGKSDKAKEMNACLAKANCDEFATCFAAIKE
jgi:hypothetical protein